MSNALVWIVDQVRWLVGLANPENLKTLINLGGPAWVGYAIIGAIVFSETGLLVGFFLPGDSLLFAAGYLASQSILNLYVLWAVLIPAAIIGDAVNYYLGLQMSERIFERGRLRFVKHHHLIKAREFYEKHGGRAIILARFVPLIRTFVPFVAGVARMKYVPFAVFNVVGGIAWVILMTLAGYLLGQIEFFKSHFELAVLAVIAISLLPIVIEVLKSHFAGRSSASPEEPVSGKCC